MHHKGEKKNKEASIQESKWIIDKKETGNQKTGKGNEKRNNKKGIDRDEWKTLLYWKKWTNRLTRG